MAVTVIEWGSPHKGGDITVDSYGVVVGTNCHGCGSEELRDVDDLIKLHQALSELIQKRTGRRGVLFQ